MPTSPTFNYANVLDAQLGRPLSNTELNIIKELKAAHPSAQHVSVFSSCRTDGPWPLSGYLRTQGIEPTVHVADTHSLSRYDADERRVYTDAIAGVSTFTYEGVVFTAYKASWIANFQEAKLYHLVFEADTDAVGQQLVDAVFKWSHELKEEIWVFESGGWSKSKKLYKAVQSASWDDVVLDEKFKEGLRRDTRTFFASKDAYDSLGITWKRGILLLGPPGNGKTESIKALLSETKGVSPLYVKSFTTRNGPENGIRAIFEHARSHVPCILILEDLDSMLIPEAKAFFLNEIDGLADNAGILTIATTNHPERIDDAILNRPSRFDVKYEYTLPDAALRTAFARKWLEKVNVSAATSGLRFAKLEETADVVAEKTDGWSFAFLKELFVSFLLRRAHDKSLGSTEAASKSPEDLLMNQVEQLAAQIIKTKQKAEAERPSGGAAALAGMNALADLFSAPACSTATGSLSYSGVNF